MKSKLLLVALLSVFVFCVNMFVMQKGANGADLGDKTLSPYFYVKSEEPDIDHFSLKSTDVSVNIAGVIADVTVTQVYKNEGKRPLETIYIFPASVRAAVYAMKMTIGERTITAKIKEREAARKEYEEAKEAGKSASLLEQQRPNVFQMNVANILPADKITVELKYTELMLPTDGVYEFIYPTVVGPRYANQIESQVADSEKWVKNPYLHEGESSPTTFNINVNLSSALPIKEITVPSHKTNVTYSGKATASVALDSSEKQGGNRDFIVKYSHSGGAIESGLLLYEGGEENFFLLMVEPPKSVALQEIPRREYIFVVDVSGSMHGFPLDTAKALLKDLIGNLKSTDIFNVLLFSGSASVMAEKSLPANTENINKAIALIDNQSGGGGTELVPALNKAFSIEGTKDFSRTIVVVTDGYVNVEKDTFELIRTNIGKANVFAFGIGSSVNRLLIDGMARAGNGEPFIVLNPNEANDKAQKLRNIIKTPVLTNVKVDYSAFDAYDVEPVSIPDVFTKRPIVVFGKWKGSKDGSITVKGLTGTNNYENTVSVNSVNVDEKNSAIRYLWARKRIECLDDYNKLNVSDERVKEVTALGLKYNLLTAYTSFVAVDSEVRLKGDRAITVKQPLPLPEGVSDLAVGGTDGRSLRKGMMMPASPAAKSFLKTEAEVAAVQTEESKPKVALQETTKVAVEGKEREGFANENEKQDDKDKEASKDSIEQPLNVEITDIKISGKVAQNEVKDAIEKHLKGFNNCYITAKAKGRAAQGEIMFYVEIDEEGKLLQANGSAISGNFKNTGILQCLIDTVKKIEFPKSSDGTKFTIKFKLKLKM
ncbi:MAG: VWA domain-containing protein [Candidatus Magnetoovum sp. WYHC-5]|nr:VWA domain-containing protein [Candidatus Magnetoovum sp. WYHC-5]